MLFSMTHQTIGFRQGEFIVEKELWSKVGVWCSENGIAAPRNKGSFTQELTRLIPQVQQTTTRVNGKVTHVYMNVSTVSTSPYLCQETKDIIPNKEGKEHPVTVDTPVTAKNCAKYRLPSCTHPNRDCVGPLYECPLKCKGFKLALGETMPDYPEGPPEDA